MTPNDRLSDEELASVAEYVDTQQASGKYGATFAKVSRAIAELRAHRAAALSAEDEEALRWAGRELTSLNEPHHTSEYEMYKRALAVLTRLTGGAP